MSGSKQERSGSSRKSSGRAGEKPRKIAKPKKKTEQEIVPIYARLPKGPHRIGPSGVAHNQRIRIHGGMIEAVTTRGYQSTSVRLVIGLAGVSRRAFYEQFSGKEDCFLETFDLIVNRALQRLSHACRTADESPESRMRMALQAVRGELEQNPKALRLAMSDAQTASPEGLRRVRRTAAVCEGLLASSFSDQRMPDALPRPVVRAILGGLARATRMRLLNDEADDLQLLTKEMLKWSLVFKSPAIHALRPRPCANQRFAEPFELEPTACGGESRRARLLRSAVAVGVRERKYEDISKLRIADHARLPIEAFMELFPGPEACYLEALDLLGDELLQLIANPGLVSAEWSIAVCHTVDTLLRYLAGSPARLVTLTAKALEAEAASANVDALAYEIATLLTEGAPRRPRTRIAVEGIAGALWYMLHCEVLAGRGHRLPVLSEYVSYVILTPFLGPDAAAQAIVQSRPAGEQPQRMPAGDPAARNGPAPRNGDAGRDGDATADGPATHNGDAARNGDARGDDGAGRDRDAADRELAVEQASGNGNGATAQHRAAATGGATPTAAAANGSAPTTGATSGVAATTEAETTANGATAAGDQEDYRRLAERRSAKCVNTTPTSTESTITTIKGA